MVVALVRPAIIIAQQVWKYRKQIYAVVSAQDRYIKGAFVGTRVSKAAQYGWRSGAAAGGILGSLNYKPAEDSPGNGLSTQIPKKPTTGKSYKARGRSTRRSSNRRFNRCNPNRYR